MNPTLKIIGIGLFYLLTIVTGIIMHKKGRPFKPLMSMLHKLIALFVLIVSILLVRDAFILEAPTLITIVLFSISMLLFIVLFVSGAMLSSDKEPASVVLVLHDVATYLAPITLGITFFLLFQN
jgi:hypothetical protein